MGTRHLPVIPTETGSLRKDGSREWIHPADVRGRFHNARRGLFFILMAVYIALPWIKIGGHPAVLLDVEHRQFFLLGESFNAQDAWLLFFVITGIAFGVAYITMLAGRAFCGWACPQTVFLDALYRPIERLINGPREARIRRERNGWSVNRAVRFGLTQAAYVTLSIALAHGFAGYFIGVTRLAAFIREGSARHPEAFAWVVALSIIFYVDFGWFREQFCLAVCPYGRLQGVLTDSDSLAIGYDVNRGEPRGKASTKAAGDCVDCRRCVVVCPTGIDIRNGTQLDCIGCTACIDACDEVMDKLERKRGLIRYDSLRGLGGEKRRIARPRLYLYSVLGVAGLIAATLALRSRVDLEANVLRQPGLPYTLEGGVVTNAFTLHLVNKRSEDAVFRVRAELPPGAPAGTQIVLPLQHARVGAMGSTEAPLFVRVPREQWRSGFGLVVRVSREGGQATSEKVVTAPILGP